MPPLPECFGVFWEGIASTPQCHVECGAKDECLAKFATETLPKYQRELGEQATVQVLAERTSVKPEAILLAINYQQQMVKAEAADPSRTPVVAPESEAVAEPVPPPVVSSDTPVPMPPPVAAPEGVPIPPPSPVAEPAPAPAISQAPPPSASEAMVSPEVSTADSGSAEESSPAEVKKPPRKRKRAAPKKGAAPKKKKAASAKKSTKATKAKSSKAGSKKKAPPKKKKGKKKGEPVNPPKAGAALHAAAPAETARGESAIPVEEQGPNRKSWSTEHDLARFKRERARNPLIRRLPRNSVLVRRWPYANNTGPKHRVVVLRDGYRYKGKKYPTLYAVVQEIAGVKEYDKQKRPDGSRPEGKKVSTSWSVTKFFGLDKEILTLEQQRAGEGKCSQPTWEGKQKKKKRKRRSKS